MSLVCVEAVVTRLPTAGAVAGFSGSDANGVVIGSGCCRRPAHAQRRPSVTHVTPAIQGTAGAPLEISTTGRGGRAPAYGTQNTSASSAGTVLEVTFPASALGRGGVRRAAEGEVR